MTQSSLFAFPSLPKFPTALRDRPPAVLMGDLCLLRPLGMAKIPTIVATCDPHDITLRSRYAAGGHVLPGFETGSSARSADVLGSLGRRLSRCAGGKIPLFCGGDAQLEFVYAFKDDLSRHYLFLLNDAELGASLLDKARFARVAREASIPTPRTLASRDDGAPGQGVLDRPFVVKPKRRISAKKIRDTWCDGRGRAKVFTRREDLFAHPAYEAQKDEILVQEHIPSSPGGLMSFHGFADKEGKILGSFVGRELRTFPGIAGESSFVEIADDVEVEDLGRSVVEKLGLKGPFKIDVIRDKIDSRLFVLEVDARFSLMSYLGAACGVNLPAIAYEYLVNGRSPKAPARARRGSRWVNLYRDFQAFKEHRERGELGPVRWMMQLAWGRTVYEAFAWTDPKPFACLLRNLLRGRARE